MCFSSYSILEDSKASRVNRRLSHYIKTICPIFCFFCVDVVLFMYCLPIPYVCICQMFVVIMIYPIPKCILHALIVEPCGVLINIMIRCLFFFFLFSLRIRTRITGTSLWSRWWSHPCYSIRSFPKTYLRCL